MNLKMLVKSRFKRTELDQGEIQDLEKAVTGYTGPMSMADITLASWNEYFREGGSLNQPRWLESNRFNEIKKQFTLLANLHQRA